MGAQVDHQRERDDHERDANKSREQSDRQHVQISHAPKRSSRGRVGARLPVSRAKRKKACFAVVQRRVQIYPGLQDSYLPRRPGGTQAAVGKANGLPA